VRWKLRHVRLESEKRSKQAIGECETAAAKQLKFNRGRAVLTRPSACQKRAAAPETNCGNDRVRFLK
jgi:hypothetical protein